MQYMVNESEIKNRILKFTVEAVEQFLKDHPDLVFYAFAFDCDLDCGDIGLCFNAESDFEKTLRKYQSGKYAEHYQTDEAVHSIKYNTGDWTHQCFANIQVLTEQQLHDIQEGHPEQQGYPSRQAFFEYLNQLFTRCILEFSKTKTFASIPKTNDFVAFSIDHDEDFENAMARLDILNQMPSVG